MPAIVYKCMYCCFEHYRNRLYFPYRENGCLRDISFRSSLRGRNPLQAYMYDMHVQKPIGKLYNLS